MSAVEDIWDLPVEPSSPRRTSAPHVVDDDDDEVDIASRSSKRPRSEPLFLVDSDDDQPSARHPAPTPSASRNEIDAMFQEAEDDDGLDFQPLAPSLDFAALTRQANAKHAKTALPSLTPHEVLPSSSPPPDGGGAAEWSAKGGKGGDDGEKKERKKIARMDETRLVGPSGFPALMKSTKDFTPKGKGHEAADLNRLLQVYQFWTHKMYPKTQFKDTVDRVEKLCHSRRMQVSLSVWRDEAKGLINGMKPEDLDDADPADGVIDLTSDIEPSHSPAKQKSKSSSPVTDLDIDMETDTPSRPPSSTTEVEDEDFDIDALIREDEEMSAKLKAASSATTSNVAASDISASKGLAKALYRQTAAAETGEDDQDMWDALDGFDGNAPLALAPKAQVKPNGGPPDEDEDMWDMADEMGMGVEAPYLPLPPAPPQNEVPHEETAAKSTDFDDIGHMNEVVKNSITTDVPDDLAEGVKPTNDDDWDDMYL